MHINLHVHVSVAQKFAKINACQIRVFKNC